MAPNRRPLRLALPFTILTAPDTVRLVAGEDFRCTLTAPGLETWLPRLLADLDGRRSLDDLLSGLAPDLREAAQGLLQRLYGERILVEAPLRDGHAPQACRLVVEGDGPLADGLRTVAAAVSETAAPLRVLCQDRLDWETLLHFNRCCRAKGDRGLWASTGAMQRGYVGPVVLPDAGPCHACMVRQFQRLSPAPALYDHLIEHVQQGRSVAPVPFPSQGVEILKQLVLWKASLLALAEPPAALYRLHVLEVATFEVSGRRVFADPECPTCGEAGG